MSKLSEVYVQEKLSESKIEDKKSEGNGRVFIFPTLQADVIGFREDETTFTSMLKFFSDPKNGLSKMKLATGYLNLQK